jgi:N-acylneuraminate cytidylyltransferase
MSIIAIIPARGGSKRIPRKNVRPFLGKPAICYAIEAALGAGIFHEVMVSTDDAQIANIASSAGASVPFLRSAKTSTDFATTAEVLCEVLGEYEARSQHFELGCCLYPTALFVTPQRLREGHERLVSDVALDGVLPVAQFGYPIWRSLKLEEGRVTMNWPENADRRSQDLPPAYHDAGQFYWFRTASLLEYRRMFMPQSAALVVPAWSVQDIDTEEDWLLAELKYEALARRGLLS